jgi:hypothetical protein
VDAEIISKKKEPGGGYRFYVHYVDCNRRLDEWVEEDKLDLNSVLVPQRVKKSQSTQSFASTSSIDQPNAEQQQQFAPADGQRQINQKKFLKFFTSFKFTWIDAGKET